MHTAIETASTSQPQRIVFIDAIRAFAILMMLQGHFIDKMLAPQFHDFDNPIYATWYFFRGITGPIFFFSTGLVFMYLLLKDNRPLSENVRVKKGLKRGLLLIFLGYVLKWSLAPLFTGVLYPWYITVDVLHCIGLGILFLIGAYAFHRVTQVSLRVLLAALALLVFMFNPSFETADWSHLPTLLENYFTLKNGSAFTPIPWIGYTFFGGVLGTWLNRHPDLAFTKRFPFILLITGFTLYLNSSRWLESLYQIIPWQNFISTAYNNHLFHRLGHVLIAVAVVIWITRWWKNMPALVTKIGSETLAIYSVHYVLLYGTWFGIGITTFLQGKLNPFWAIFGALLFVSSFVIFVIYIEEIRAWLRKDVPAFFKNRWRLFRVKIVRLYFKLAYKEN